LPAAPSLWIRGAWQGKVRAILIAVECMNNVSTIRMVNLHLLLIKVANDTSKTWLAWSGYQEGVWSLLAAHPIWTAAVPPTDWPISKAGSGMR
jgi:hypothetical protein